MSDITKSVATKVTYHNGVVSLEIAVEETFPPKYTIWVGPHEQQFKGRTRLQLGQENFDALLRLLEEAGFASKLSTLVLEEKP